MNGFFQIGVFHPKTSQNIGTLCAVETGGHKLSNFVHPTRCVYLLGAEDYGIPREYLSRCRYHLSIETMGIASLNVSTAGSIVMYDRYSKILRK